LLDQPATLSNKRTPDVYGTLTCYLES